MKNQSGITVSQETRDQLNAARKERGLSWDAFLREIALAHETQGDAREVDLAPGTINDIAEDLGPRIAEEVLKRTR